MSWAETPVTVKRHAPAGRVTFKSNCGRSLGALVGIPAAVAEQLGWKSGAKLRLLVGSGEHDGWLRIEPSEKGEALFAGLGKKGRGGRAKLGTFPRLSGEAVEKTAVEHRVIGKALELHAPPGAILKPKAVAVA